MAKFKEALKAKGLTEEQLSAKLKNEILAYNEVEKDLVAMEENLTGEITEREKKSTEKKIEEYKSALQDQDEFLTKAISKFDLEKYQKNVEKGKALGAARKNKKASGGNVSTETTPPAEVTPPAQVASTEAETTPPAEVTPPEEVTPPAEVKKEKGGVSAGAIAAGVGVAVLAYFGIAWKKEWFPFNNRF